MKLGISTYTYTWNFGVPGDKPKNPWDLEKLIKQALKWGISQVQIADNFPLHELSKKELEKIRSITNNQPVQIEVGARGLTPGHLDLYLEIADFFFISIFKICN